MTASVSGVPLELFNAKVSTGLSPEVTIPYPNSGRGTCKIVVRVGGTGDVTNVIEVHGKSLTPGDFITLAGLLSDDNNAAPLRYNNFLPRTPAAVIDLSLDEVYHDVPLLPVMRAEIVTRVTGTISMWIIPD